MKLTPSDSSGNQNLIRFERKHGEHVNVAVHDILYGLAKDHYVHVLIAEGKDCAWMVRRISLVDMLKLLPEKPFLRINRFSFVNIERLIKFEEEKQILHFGDDATCIVTVEHGIHKYIRDQLRR